MINHKRVYRIYTSLKLQRPKKTTRGKTNQTAKPENLTEPLHPHHVWAIDFTFIKLSNEREVKILTIEDLYNRKALKTYADFSIRHSQVIEVLKECFALYGKPKILRSDNGREFIARQLKVFLSQERISQQFIPAGEPYWNGKLERLNGTLKEECLSLNSFDTLQEVRMALEAYLVFYNEKRPHFSLNFLSPVQYERSLVLKCSSTKSVSQQKDVSP